MLIKNKITCTLGSGVGIGSYCTVLNSAIGLVAVKCYDAIDDKNVVVSFGKITKIFKNGKILIVSF